VNAASALASFCRDTVVDGFARDQCIRGYTADGRYHAPDSDPYAPVTSEVCSIKTNECRPGPRTATLGCTATWHNGMPGSTFGGSTSLANSFQTGLDTALDASGAKLGISNASGYSVTDQFGRTWNWNPITGLDSSVCGNLVSDALNSCSCASVCAAPPPPMTLGLGGGISLSN
jgi:hypothetical protein